MGVLIFTVLRISGVLQTDWDWVIGCFLVSLDSIALSVFYLGSTLRTFAKGEFGSQTDAEKITVSSEDETRTES